MARRRKAPKHVVHHAHHVHRKATAHAPKHKAAHHAAAHHAAHHVAHHAAVHKAAGLKPAAKRKAVTPKKPSIVHIYLGG